MSEPMFGVDVCVSDLQEGFDANAIADAVATYAGSPILVLSVYKDRLELRLPHYRQAVMIKAAIEGFLDYRVTVAEIARY